MGRVGQAGRSVEVADIAGFDKSIICPAVSHTAPWLFPSAPHVPRWRPASIAVKVVHINQFAPLPHTPRVGFHSAGSSLSPPLKMFLPMT